MPTIKPAENGPYIVTGLTKVIRAADGKEYEVNGTAALCRCGGSKNKPFCDGTHASNGFSGAKEADRVPDRRESYEGDGVTIHDNRGLCAHAARCDLASVFRPREEPWINPTGAERDAIIDTIRKCPSGALSYSVDGVEHRDRGGEPGVAFAPNGPYIVKGGCELQGEQFPEGGTQDHFTLCRCGRSKNKPFCNGAHWYHKFDEQAEA